MIVRPRADELLVVTQTDHARLAADWLALVRRPELESHPRRAELLRAVAEHDNGWWESDAAPALDPESGGPTDFRRVPTGLRCQIWERAVERHAADAPGVAARIATHALRLFAGRQAEPGSEELVDLLTRRREELAAAAGLGADELARDDAWLRLADEVSLAACTGLPTMVSAAGWRAETAESGEELEVRLDPFPMAGATRLDLRLRRLPRRSYRRDAEVALALATSLWEQLPVRFAPN